MTTVAMTSPSPLRLSMYPQPFIRRSAALSNAPAASRSCKADREIGGLIEPDVAIAHLQKREAGRRRCARVADQTYGMRDATADSPQDAGSSPDHAFEGVAAAEVGMIF